jgi:toxin FitB
VIVFDMNVVSELMRDEPAVTVRRWADRQSPTSLFVTSVTQAEILLGLELMPKGKRRDALVEKATILFDGIFGTRVLPFGGDAASAYAKITATRRRRGRPISALDAQIAAIARASEATVATRNVGDFTDCGIEVVDPWRER